MKHIYVIILILLVFTACSDVKPYEQVMDRADGMMNSAPDSALVALDSIGGEVETLPRRIRMLAECEEMYLPLRE